MTQKCIVCSVKQNAESWYNITAIAFIINIYVIHLSRCCVFFGNWVYVLSLSTQTFTIHTIMIMVGLSNSENSENSEN